MEKLLELPFRNKCGQLARYILKTNWRPTLIGVKTGPLFSLGLLWPSVTLMFSTIFVPIHAIFTHPSDTNLISFLLAPLLYHCPVGSSDKNTINETEKKQEASRQVAALQTIGKSSLYFYAAVQKYFLGLDYICICMNCLACLRFFQEAEAINVWDRGCS